MTTDLLRESWAELVPDRPDLGEGLLARWSEPHRHYHDRRHLAEMLIMIDQLGEPDHDRRTVALATWYHDAIYATGAEAADNEKRSAELARAELAPALGAEIAAEVGRLVLITADHRYADDDHDAALLCDADLAVLAAEPDRYAEYARAIRAEYAEIPDADFRSGRARILLGLLEQPLFHTARGRLLERRARENLTAELRALVPDQERS